MIFPLPSHFNWSFVAVPVWQPAAPEPAPSGTPLPSIDLAPGSGGQAVVTIEVSEPQAPSGPRLVFKGYEYRPVVQWHPFVNPAWDHFIDNDADEIRERELRADRDRLPVAPPSTAVPPGGPLPPHAVPPSRCAAEAPDPAAPAVRPLPDAG
jgi:hypothetical protein